MKSDVLRQILGKSLRILLKILKNLAIIVFLKTIPLIKLV